MNRLFVLFVLVILSCSKNDPVTPIINPTFPVEAKCENGFAGIYACNDYDLVAKVDFSKLDPTTSSSVAEGNDCWGWTDPTNQKEYALMGLTTGLSFVDISNPNEPLVLGFLPTATVASDWRDIKVYGNYAFIVSEASNHGMQVFDLTKLRSVSNPPVVFAAETTYTGFGNAHNIVINENSSYAYVVGTNTYSGGPHIVDITNPTSPVEAGGVSNLGYSHDAQVVTYNGPDTRYTGKEIYVGSNENRVVIVDVTDPSRPVQISTINYSNIGYTHQGWFTEDMHYFLIGDELDELRFGGNTKTIVFDFTDLQNPKLHMNYLGRTPAIDHNGYVKGNLFYQANYTAGVRMIDITNIATKTIQEVGFFDTHPSKNTASFSGAWSVYPYFASGNIVISDINEGLFIIRKSQ